MRNGSRVLMIIAGILLSSLFFFPMWRITLLAPQYPEGVSMHIYINKIGGESKSTLQNINILNHYVGMKYIEPDAIPELKYFKYIIAGMIILGLLFAMINKPNLYLMWGILMILMCVAGLYDFYLWEYDYGHNLSETAPIKVPGASFQPPLFGSKIILNFVAKSFPMLGGYLAGASILFSFLAWKFYKK